MKTILATYCVTFEAEIPEEDFDRAMQADGQSRAAIFNDAISKNSSIWEALPPDGEITGVYNPIHVDQETKEWYWVNDDDCEAYWEEG